MVRVEETRRARVLRLDEALRSRCEGRCVWGDGGALVEGCEGGREGEELGGQEVEWCRGG